MIYMLECPLHTQMFKVIEALTSSTVKTSLPTGLYQQPCQFFTFFYPLQIKDVFNWTATYRSDSTIVAPYERWQYYNDNVRQESAI